MDYRGWMIMGKIGKGTRVWDEKGLWGDTRTMEDKD